LTGNFWQEYVPNWPQLQVLDISKTALSGSLPDIVPGGPLSRLRSLHAASTLLTGTLPTTLALVSNLQDLSLSQLDGIGLTPRPFPVEYGKLTALQTLSLQSSGALSGSLPTEIGFLTVLTTLDLYYTYTLTGTIPTEIGRLTNLEILRLHYTKLSGTVPAELGACTTLTDLQIQATKLSGSMPDEICALEIPWLSADCMDGGAGIPPKIICGSCCMCYYNF
jgi:Leucine-rich repeat (LRR) protein